jgi:hypothetical protein
MPSERVLAAAEGASAHPFGEFGEPDVAGLL